MTSPKPDKGSKMPHAGGSQRSGSELPFKSTFQNEASFVRTRPQAITRYSTMSLPRFRQENPRLFWPATTQDDKIEIKLSENLTNPDIYGIEYLDCVVGVSGNKSMVIKGKVWKEDRQLELLAVKIIPYEDKQTQSKAFKELRILQSIKHHHIIAAIGSCSTELNGKIRLGILLYPLAKMNLEQYFKTISEDPVAEFKARSAQELLSYYACLCQTVLHLHPRKSPIKHRDIKPTNILIDSEGTVILADFDIAKQYDDKTMAFTVRGMEYTVKYAPKHVVNRLQAGLEWDINCLGFVFLEMATIILGKTIEELVVFLSEKNGPVVTKCEGIARTTGTTETAEMTEIRFSDALEKGSIGEWLVELRRHASANQDMIPVRLRMSVEKFLGMINTMMWTKTDGDGNVLCKAHEFFSTLSEPCKYCRASFVVPDNTAIITPSKHSEIGHSTTNGTADMSSLPTRLTKADNTAHRIDHPQQPPLKSPSTKGTGKGKTPVITGSPSSIPLSLRSKGKKL